MYLNAMTQPPPAPTARGQQFSPGARSHEILHVLEGVFHVRKAVALLNDLRVHETAVLEVNVAERSTVLVGPLPVVFHPHAFALDQLGRNALASFARKAA